MVAEIFISGNLDWIEDVLPLTREMASKYPILGVKFKAFTVKL